MGFNIIALNSSSLSTIYAYNHFNTYSYADSNVGMKNFIENSILTGQYVLVAVRDEGSYLLN